MLSVQRLWSVTHDPHNLTKPCFGVLSGNGEALQPRRGFVALWGFRMKRGTIEHPKTAELAAALGVPLLMAVGVLESLWHWTTKYAPRGDVGRYSNAAIAMGIHWHDGPDRVIDALVETRWMDKSDTCRLIVHDWADHADKYTQEALADSGRDFADGRKPLSRKPGPKGKAPPEEIGGSSSEDRPEIGGGSSIPNLTSSPQVSPITQPPLPQVQAGSESGLIARIEAGRQVDTRTVREWCVGNRITGKLRNSAVDTPGVTVAALEAERVSAAGDRTVKNPAATAIYRVCDALGQPPPPAKAIGSGGKLAAEDFAAVVDRIRYNRMGKANHGS